MRNSLRFVERVMRVCGEGYVGLLRGLCGFVERVPMSSLRVCGEGYR